MLFKQRLFSWFDSYDVYDEEGNTVYVVKGEPSWGHILRIHDALDNEVGCVKEKIISWIPEFEVYQGERYIGCIKKAITFFKPKFNLDYNGWQVNGNWIEWDYTIQDSVGRDLAIITKQIWNWTDTYTIDIHKKTSQTKCNTKILLRLNATLNLHSCIYFEN